jgi:hypothetical protein
MEVYPVCCPMEVVEEEAEKLKINCVMLMFSVQSMETGDHGLVTVNVTLLVVEETNKEHVSAKEQHMVDYSVCCRMEVV